MRLVESKKTGKNSDRGPKFVVASDLAAADLKKKSSGMSGLHKKLFKGSTGSVAKRGDESSKKALTEVKSNTRTLAMVLRSERELLIMKKEQDEQISELNLSLLEKNREVEKLKDLCLKQREEIMSLKNSILFPDVMNTQLEDLLEKQGSELIHAKQLIPNLQKQVTSLTGQLQSLADDIAEVKADKYSGRGFIDNHFSSPRTPSFDQDEAVNSLFDLEYSSGDYTTPDSPDEMILKDLNPCLTPHYDKTKSKNFDIYNSPDDKVVYNTRTTKLSKSSDHCQSSKGVKGLIRTISRSGDSKQTYGKKTEFKRF
ncbi:hypothetical protein CASFOL_028663 [Castilleja foliolosa]|uniref:Uncharacterized protein n=1 Tax=Castilleja foliolosa TaxID=1961234 RepID=A0ABD3CBT6_9LAMI